MAATITTMAATTTTKTATTTTKTAMTTMTDAWINHGVPGREGAGPYGVWRSGVPPLADTNLFPDITSVELAHRHKDRIEARVRSPTWCKLIFDCKADSSGNVAFYKDPQGWVVWECTLDGAVVAGVWWNGDAITPKHRVAASLGEFFTRLAIEADLCHNAPLFDYPKDVAERYLAYYKPPAQPDDAKAAISTVSADRKAAVSPDRKTAVAAEQRPAAATEATAAPAPLLGSTKRSAVVAFRVRPQVVVGDLSGALKHEVERVMALFERGFASTVYTLADDPDTLYNKVVYTPVGDGARVSRRVESGPGCCGGGPAETYSCLGAAAELNWYLQRYHKSDVLRTTNGLPPLATAASAGIVFDWSLLGALQLAHSIPVIDPHRRADPSVLRRMDAYNEAARRHTAGQRRRLYLLLVDLCASFRAARSANDTELDFSSLGSVG